MWLLWVRQGQEDESSQQQAKQELSAILKPHNTTFDFIHPPTGKHTPKPLSCCCELCATLSQCCRVWPGKPSQRRRPPLPPASSLEMEQLPRLPVPGLLPPPRCRPAPSTFAGHGHDGCLAGPSRARRNRRVHRGKSNLAFRFQVRWAGEGREGGDKQTRRGLTIAHLNLIPRTTLERRRFPLAFPYRGSSSTS